MTNACRILRCTNVLEPVARRNSETVAKSEKYSVL
jgi:hypothetical protein